MIVLSRAVSFRLQIVARFWHAVHGDGGTLSVCFVGGSWISGQHFFSGFADMKLLDYLFKIKITTF